MAAGVAGHWGFDGFGRGRPTMNSAPPTAAFAAFDVPSFPNPGAASGAPPPVAPTPPAPASAAPAAPSPQPEGLMSILHDIQAEQTRARQEAAQLATTMLDRVAELEARVAGNEGDSVQEQAESEDPRSAVLPRGLAALDVERWAERSPQERTGVTLRVREHFNPVTTASVGDHLRPQAREALSRLEDVDLIAANLGLLGSLDEAEQLLVLLAQNAVRRVQALKHGLEHGWDAAEAFERAGRSRDCPQFLEKEEKAAEKAAGKKQKGSTDGDQKSSTEGVASDKKPFRRWADKKKRN